MMRDPQGRNRERYLGRDAYFSDAYFSMEQLCTYAHQLHSIWRMRPSNVIEIGIGNGFVSSYLRRAGVPVTTVDINPTLNPDICADLKDLPSLSDEKYDLVVCCEVLEHMPFEELGANVDSMKAIGNRLLLTLPSAHRILGFGGFLSIPRIGRLVSVHIDTPARKPLFSAHYWELGSTRACTRSTVTRMLRDRYESCRSTRLSLQPYHWLFECS